MRVLLLEEPSQNQIRPGFSTHWICIRLKHVLSSDCWGPDLLGPQEMAGSEPGALPPQPPNPGIPETLQPGLSQSRRQAGRGP